VKEYIKKENCNDISTGHYVKTKIRNEKKFIYKGMDPEKGQSFFLGD